MRPRAGPFLVLLPLALVVGTALLLARTFPRGSDDAPPTPVARDPEPRPALPAAAEREPAPRTHVLLVPDVDHDGEEAPSAAPQLELPIDGDAHPPRAVPAPPCTTLVGSVAAPPGVAPADLSVELAVCRAGTWTRRRAVVDDAGRFRIPDVPDSEIADTVQFRVQARGALPRTVSLPRERALSGPVLEALPDVLVHVRLVDADGSPRAGVRLATWYGPVDHAAASSGADGRAALRLPARWGGWLHVSGPGIASDEVLVTLGDAEEHDQGDVVVGPPGRVEGVLVDAEGRPIAGKPVVLEREPSGRSAGTFETDASGRFVAEGLPTGPYVLFICWWEPDGTRRGARASGVAAGTLDLRLVARPLVGLHIRIVDHVYGKPVAVPRATTVVRAVDPARPAWSHYWAGADMSSFGLELDRPGIYEVTVATPFHAPSVVSDVVVEEGRDTDVEVVLRPH